MPDLRDSLARELELLRDQSLYRECRASVGASGPHGSLEFGSNDYLGLSIHPQVIDAASKALKSLGAGATGSRLTSGTRPDHLELERELATWKGEAEALLFSSGYLAAVGTIPALAGRHDLILSDELNHACLIDGCRLSRATVRIYRHSDLSHAAELLCDRNQFRRLLVVTDGVFSMDGDLAPLPELVELCEQQDGWLMVDDAHGTGVLGRTGAGTVEHFGLHARVAVQMGTASKALGAEGGFIAGSSELVSYLRNRARSFIFSTACPPGTVAAVRTALRIARADVDLRARLTRNSETMRFGLRQNKLEVAEGSTPIVPVIIGEADRALRVSERLRAQGFQIPAIRPPTVPQGTARLRVTVTALHTCEQIQQAVGAIAEAVRDA